MEVVQKFSEKLGTYQDLREQVQQQDRGGSAQAFEVRGYGSGRAGVGCKV